MQVAGIVQDLHLTQLGYGSTSVDLFDLEHFLRTVPAEDATVEVVVGLMQQMRWQQVKAFRTV